MKRNVSLLLVLLMLLSVIPFTAYAANVGPSMDNTYEEEGEDGYYFSYIKFIWLDNNGKVVNTVDEFGDKEPYTRDVFSNFEEHNNDVRGAEYDLDTNTLTLTDFNGAQKILEINAMGDDFTINLVGDCELAAIKSKAENWGSAINIQGNGSLIVNQNKWFDKAIVVAAEELETNVNFGINASVKLYADNGVISVEGVANPDLTDLVTFENGDTIEMTKETYLQENNLVVCGYELKNLTHKSVQNKVYCESDPSGVYTIEERFDQEDEEDCYAIKKYVFSESYGRYFTDGTFGDRGEMIVYVEDFEDSGFTLYDDEASPDEVGFENIGEDEYFELPAYKDENGNIYAVNDYYDEEADEFFTRIYTMQPIADIGEEGNPFYIFNKVNGVDVDELEEATELVPVEGLYTYKTVCDELIVEGEKIIEDEVVSIPLIDVGNVYTTLSTTVPVIFTGEVNPNSDCPQQMRVYNEIWTNKKDGTVYDLRNEGTLKGAQTYSYSIVLKAYDGYVFEDGFDFIYGGTKYTPSYEIYDDGKTIKLTSFVADQLVNKMSVCTVSGVKNKEYTGKKITLSLTVKNGSYKLIEGKDYTLTYSKNVDVGKVTVTIKGKGAYTSSIMREFQIVKAKNPIKIKTKYSAKTIKASSLRNAKKVFATITTSKAQGKVSFSKKSGSKALSVSSKGKVTIKKGTKKGTYSITVKVKAKGTSNYKEAIIDNVKITVKVK